MIPDSQQRLAKAIIELRELVVRTDFAWFGGLRPTLNQGLCTDSAIILKRSRSPSRGKAIGRVECLSRCSPGRFLEA